MQQTSAKTSRKYINKSVQNNSVGDQFGWAGQRKKIVKIYSLELSAMPYILCSEVSISMV